MVNIGEYIPLIIFVLFIFYMVIRKYRRDERRHIVDQARRLEQAGHYHDALREYLRASLHEAARLVLRAPPASQALLYQTLLQTIDMERVHAVLLRVISEAMEKGEILQAVNGYLLLNMPDKAIETLLLDDKSHQYLPLVVRIIEERPHVYVDKIRTARKYAQFLVNHGKFRDAFELLQSIGDQEGANLLFSEARRRFEQQGDWYHLRQITQIAEENPIVEVLDLLKMAEKNFQAGNLTKARSYFSTMLAKWQRAQVILQDSNGDLSRDLMELEARIDKLGMIFRLIDAAREMLRYGDKERARQLFRELLDNCELESLPATVLAEIALAHEGDYPKESSRFYRLAASKAKTSRARNTFISLAQEQDSLEPPRSLLREQEATPSQSEKKSIQANTAIESSGQLSVAVQYDKLQEILEEDLRCSVCQIIIEDQSELVRCEVCNSPAHYGHLAEWLKIKGTCPICREKIDLPPPPSNF